MPITDSLKRLPIFEYVDGAVGRTWTAEDAAYVREVFECVDQLAVRLVEQAKRGLLR